MSKLLDRFRYFKTKGDSFADGHGKVYHTNRDWEASASRQSSISLRRTSGYLRRLAL